MRLLEKSHIIKMSNSKEEIRITRLQAEHLILLLSKPQKPQFINVDGNMLNTSFMVGIMEGGDKDTPNPQQQRELTDEEKQIHQQYLNYINNQKLLK